MRVRACQSVTGFMFIIYTIAIRQASGGQQQQRGSWGFPESELFIFYFPEGYANYWRTLQVHGAVFKAEELSAPQHVTIGNVNLPNDYYN